MVTVTRSLIKNISGNEKVVSFRFSEQVSVGMLYCWTKHIAIFKIRCERILKGSFLMNRINNCAKCWACLKLNFVMLKTRPPAITCWGKDQSLNSQGPPYGNACKVYTFSYLFVGFSSIHLTQLSEGIYCCIIIWVIPQRETSICQICAPIQRTWKQDLL